MSKRDTDTDDEVWGKLDPETLVNDQYPLEWSVHPLGLSLLSLDVGVSETFQD